MRGVKLFFIAFFSVLTTVIADFSITSTPLNFLLLISLRGLLVIFISCIITFYLFYQFFFTPPHSVLILMVCLFYVLLGTILYELLKRSRCWSSLPHEVAIRLTLKNKFDFDIFMHIAACFLKSSTILMHIAEFATN